MVTRFGRAVVFGLVGAFGVAASSGARAADRGEDDLIRRGVEARKRRADTEAFELFEQAYAIRHSPRSAAQMGLAEVALGRWIQAEAHLAESLRARDDGWIKKNARTLTETLERARDELGTLDVLGRPAGAEIVIAGEVRGTLPLASPIRVRAGDVQFQLRAAGHLSETRSVRVKARELVRETVYLSQSRLAPPPLPPPPLAGLSADREPAGGKIDDAALSRRASPSSDSGADARAAAPNSAGRSARIAGIVAASLGVAAVGAGTAFALKVRAAGIDASHAPVHDPNASSIGRRDERLQWICYGAGAALLTGGLVSYLVGASRGKVGVAELGLTPMADGGSAWLGGAF